MSEISFFDGDIIPDDVVKKNDAIRKMTMAVGNTYADNNSYKSLTEENVFDFEKKKKLLIDDLDWIKHLKVEEFTFFKKFEEIKLVSDFIKRFENQAKAKIWNPTDINNEELTIREIKELQPKVIVVSDKSSELLWTTLRVYCSTAEYNQAPGRFIKFLMVDDISDKILGIASIASDVISISDRDKFIGWNPEDKLKYKMLKYSAIGTTIVPTQPFGSNFLGGKLVAAMVTSDVIRNEWETQRGECMPCKLVGMTTTSLYGSFSMYNSLKWWKSVGESKGKIPIKPQEKYYKEWHDWLKKEHEDEYNKMMTQKEGIAGPVTGAKMRVLSMIFKYAGIKQSSYYHEHARGVYYSCFYENTKEFLCRKITEDKLIMKSLFKDNTNAILSWWKPKAIERYKRLKVEGRLNSNKLFYSIVDDNHEMEYEEFKSKYFKDVNVGKNNKK